MASPEFTAFAERAHHSPVCIVKASLPNGVGTGTTDFYFCDHYATLMSLRVLYPSAGMVRDLIPVLLKAGGISTSIDPGKVATTRSVRSLTFRDVPDWPESLGAGSLVTTGGSLFQRLQLGFPGWHRAKVEVLIGGDEAAMADLSKWETFALAQLEDWRFEGDNEVEWVLSDIYELKGAEIPTPVGDDNLLVGAHTSTQVLFSVSNPDAFLDPSTELPSRDWLAPVLVIEPDTADEERVLVSHKDSNGLWCCQNWLTDSEDLSTANWAVIAGAWTRTPNAYAGPWGPENAALLETAGAGTLRQDVATVGTAFEANISFWLREHPNDPGRQVTVSIADVGGSGSNAFVATLTPYWKRYDVGVSPAGAVATYRIQVSVAAAAKFYATQGQLTYGPTGSYITKRFYVEGTGPTAGGYAGRGAFGSTRTSHANNDPVTERTYYRVNDGRADSAAEGLHPVWIVADLLNRAHVPPSWQDATLHLERFQQEADYRSGSRFRRVLIDPQGAEDLVVEVCQAYMLSVWSDRKGFMKCRLDWRPMGPGVSWTTLTKEHDLHQRGEGKTGFRLEANKGSRVNWVRVHWGLRVDSDGKEKAGDRAEDYLHYVVRGDFRPDVVGSDFRSLRGKTLFVKWIYQSADATGLAGRILARFATGARRVFATVGFRRFLTMDVGESYRIDHPTLKARVGSAAVRAPTLFQATQLDYGEHCEDIAGRFLESRQSRLGHITPTTNDTFPGGISVGGTFPVDYDLATPAQKEFYGFIGDTDNLVGTPPEPGYVIA